MAGDKAGNVLALCLIITMENNQDVVSFFDGFSEEYFLAPTETQIAWVAENGAVLRALAVLSQSLISIVGAAVIDTENVEAQSWG